MRINVFEYTDYAEPQLVGWFKDTSAVHWTEDGPWNDRATHEELYRTAKGRWVRHDWTQYRGSEAKYWFVSEDKARTWLLANGYDADVEKFFGRLEEEAGPKLGGRPSIGPKVEVRLPQEVLNQVDDFKGDRDRADALRELIEAGLDALAPA